MSRFPPLVYELTSTRCASAPACESLVTLHEAAFVPQLTRCQQPGTPAAFTTSREGLSRSPAWFATVTAALTVETTPEESTARAATRAGPSASVAVSHVTEYGAEESAPTSASLTRNSTRSMPIADEAVAVRLTVPRTKEASVGVTSATVGGVGPRSSSVK